MKQYLTKCYLWTLPLWVSLSVACAPPLPSATTPYQFVGQMAFSSPAANRKVDSEYAHSTASLLRAYLRHHWEIVQLDLKQGKFEAQLCYRGPPRPPHLGVPVGPRWGGTAVPGTSRDERARTKSVPDAPGRGENHG